MYILYVLHVPFMFPTAGRNVLCISDVFSDCAAYEGKGGGEGEGGGYARQLRPTSLPPKYIYIRTGTPFTRNQGLKERGGHFFKWPLTV